jgi:hypothetical protein
MYILVSVDARSIAVYSRGASALLHFGLAAPLPVIPGHAVLSGQPA